MPSPQLNKIQVSILYSLRHATSARYSELMRPTNLTSDSFKFHLRNLVKSGFVTKLDDGAYALTAAGKEFANNLDQTEGTTQKQPKLTLRVCLSRQNEVGETEYLLQERHRNPYWGYWDPIGGPVPWGVSIEEAAAQELKKQTGLSANLSVQAFLRVRDYDEQADQLLEDKLFAVLSADDFDGELTPDWRGGQNAWMTTEQLLATGKYFASTPKMFKQLNGGPLYDTDDLRYGPENY